MLASWICLLTSLDTNWKTTGPKLFLGLEIMHQSIDHSTEEKVFVPEIYKTKQISRETVTAHAKSLLELYRARMHDELQTARLGMGNYAFPVETSLKLADKISSYERVSPRLAGTITASLKLPNWNIKRDDRLSECRWDSSKLLYEMENYDNHNTLNLSQELEAEKTAISSEQTALLRQISSLTVKTQQNLEVCLKQLEKNSTSNRIRGRKSIFLEQMKSTMDEILQLNQTKRVLKKQLGANLSQICRSRTEFSYNCPKQSVEVKIPPSFNISDGDQLHVGDCVHGPKSICVGEIEETQDGPSKQMAIDFTHLTNRNLSSHLKSSAFEICDCPHSFQNENDHQNLKNDCRKEKINCNSSPTTKSGQHNSFNSFKKSELNFTVGKDARGRTKSTNILDSLEFCSSSSDDSSGYKNEVVWNQFSSEIRLSSLNVDYEGTVENVSVSVVSLSSPSSNSDTFIGTTAQRPSSEFDNEFDRLSVSRWELPERINGSHTQKEALNLSVYWNFEPNEMEQNSHVSPFQSLDSSEQHQHNILTVSEPFNNSKKENLPSTTLPSFTTSPYLEDLFTSPLEESSMQIQTEEAAMVEVSLLPENGLENISFAESVQNNNLKPSTFSRSLDQEYKKTKPAPKVSWLYSIFGMKSTAQREHEALIV